MQYAYLFMPTFFFFLSVYADFLKQKDALLLKIDVLGINGDNSPLTLSLIA